MANVQVTLNKPYSGVCTAPKGQLRLRFDSHPATRIVPPKMGEDDTTPMFTVGAIRYKRGEPIWYPASGALIADDEANQSCLMPIEVAKHFFGDWTIEQGHSSPGDPRRSWGVERNRMFQVWGDYRYDVSKMSADHTPLGPPAVPYVTIKLVNDRGVIEHDWTFEPRVYWQVPEPEAPARNVELVLAQDIDMGKIVSEIRAQLAIEEQQKQAVKRKTGRPRKVVPNG